MKTKLWSKRIWLLNLVSFAIVLSSPLLHAAETLPNASFLFSHPGYNYAPSVIDNGVTEKFWWCGYGTPSGSTTQTDVIYYTTYDWGTKTWGSINQVLAPTLGDWDGLYTCDPSVIQGSFVDPDNGLTYGYAMYYTGTNNGAIAGSVNSIGVAFSNDGVTWVKYKENPIVAQQVPMLGTYGAGQPATYNLDGKAHIFLFYTDTSTSYGQRAWLRTAMDGINFGAPLLISNQSADGYTLCVNSDFAYDYQTNSFYAAFETCGTNRSGERETYQFGLYRLSGDLLVEGQGVWQPLGYVNTAMTGFELNHSPGLRRDGFGNVTPWLPLVSVYFAGGTNDPNTWNLSAVGWNPNPSTFALSRYAEYPNGHWVTTGYVAPGYALESVLGYLLMTEAPNTNAIYSCQLSDGIHQMISLDSSCEGQKPLGVIGWIYQTPPSNTSVVAIYRCSVAGGDHFASLDPNCEGQTIENGGLPLGYALSNL